MCGSISTHALRHHLARALLHALVDDELVREEAEELVGGGVDAEVDVGEAGMQGERYIAAAMAQHVLGLIEVWCAERKRQLVGLLPCMGELEDMDPAGGNACTAVANNVLHLDLVTSVFMYLRSWLPGMSLQSIWENWLHHEPEGVHTVWMSSMCAGGGREGEEGTDMDDPGEPWCMLLGRDDVYIPIWKYGLLPTSYMEQPEHLSRGRLADNYPSNPLVPDGTPFWTGFQAVLPMLHNLRSLAFSFREDNEDALNQIIWDGCLATSLPPNIHALHLKFLYKPLRGRAFFWLGQVRCYIPSQRKTRIVLLGFRRRNQCGTWRSKCGPQKGQEVGWLFSQAPHSAGCATVWLLSRDKMRAVPRLATDPKAE
ncbi:hypothetical protein C8J57DRAFT_1227256 [Mycena rebaudengoi]|nr:hypothetical protein C8J57DRAFT_1227256 [Mycena rebaudengoi]